MRKVLVVIAAMAGVGGLTGVALAASSPTVSTGSASSVGSTSAVLNGTVNPNGSGTTYQFQWGVTTAYGGISTSHSAGSAKKALSVRVTASGLIPGTRYHFRLTAVNNSGVSVGADRTFTTGGHPPPGVATGPASVTGTTTTTVTGIIDPHGQATTWQFQYGPTALYGMESFSATLPAGNSIAAVSAPLSGLAPGTIFHYRLVATHGGNIVIFGNDETFMTFPSPRPVPRILASTKPHRDRRKPFIFTTSGKLTGARSIPPADGCAGNVTIAFFNGKSPVSLVLAPVQPNCAFSGQTSFAHKFGGHSKRLKVLIHYQGTGYLAPASAHSETVTVG